MKKIAIVVHGLSGGGAERVASLLASYLVNHQYEVLYICAFNDEKTDNQARYALDSRVRVKYVAAKSNISPIRFATRSLRIRAMVREFAPDYVLSLIISEAVLTALSKYPLIFSLRNDPGTYMSLGIRTKLLQVMLSRAKKVVFQSAAARNYFDGAIREKGVVIPNPVNTKKLPLWTAFDHEKTFISACRLEEQKNMPMLVEAFSMVHQEHPDYRLEVYGKGDMEEALSAQIHALHAEDYIILKGFSSDIHAVMAHSSGFVLPSNYEGLSNSLLEALCIGVPCVSTDHAPGSAREYITSGENGFLTKVGDAQDMKEKICALIENEELSRTFAERNLAIRERLDVEVICKEWAKLFT